MECRDAQFYLRLRRHAADELGADVTAPLDGHLATCAVCSALAKASADFDRAVSVAMLSVPVPAGLRERLITQAARAQGAALRRTAFRYGGLVAAALLMVAIGIGIYSNGRPKVDSSALVQRNDGLFNDPRGYTQAWLADEGLPEHLPWDFDYKLLVGCGEEKIGGRRVPVVTFRARDGEGLAKVYVFREGSAFDTKDLQDAQASHFNAHVVVKQEWRNVKYLVVHTGLPNQGLQQFLRPVGEPI